MFSWKLESERSAWPAGASGSDRDVMRILSVSFPGGSDGKESACNAGDVGLIPGPGRSLKEEMATQSSNLV